MSTHGPNPSWKEYYQLHGSLDAARMEALKLKLALREILAQSPPPNIKAIVDEALEP